MEINVDGEIPQHINCAVKKTHHLMSGLGIFSIPGDSYISVFSQKYKTCLISTLKRDRTALEASAHKFIPPEATSFNHTFIYVDLFCGFYFYRDNFRLILSYFPTISPSSRA